MPIEAFDETVYIIAPTGRDGVLLGQFLEKRGHATQEFQDMPALCTVLSQGGGLVVLAEEILSRDTLPVLCDSLRGQPQWSAIPIIVLTWSGSETPNNADLLTSLSEVGNVTQIERPVRPATLLSVIESGLRARRRQYEVRLHLEQEQRSHREREELLAREKAAREAAEEASRLKDEFLATVSHELRTPLMAILGWANILQTSDVDHQTLASGLETIERNARTQVQLINDLLDVARVVSGKLRLDLNPTDPSPIVNAAVNVVRPAAEAKNISLEVVAAPVGIISADDERLQQVVTNLLTNAVKFTPSGGNIVVRLRRAGNEVEILVQDSGRGIAPEFLPQVFEQFRQADQSSTRSYGGLGLGLAIVRQLVGLHGGTVQALSEGEGKGATFIVKLPLITSMTTQPVVPPEGEVSSRPLDSVRLLVVDDEKDTRDLLRTVFERSGATVEIAESAPEAFRLFVMSPPDALISDIGMPEEDGYSLIARIRGLAPQEGGATPAVALTAFVRSEDQARALASGFQRHMSKPLQVNELVRAVRELLGGE
jgi:signal transduction histidine kinase/ActR/RegA family two-component response regulator